MSTTIEIPEGAPAGTLLRSTSSSTGAQFVVHGVDGNLHAWYDSWGGPWRDRGPIAEPVDVWLTFDWEVVPAALPDPRGDLPDGTKIRITYEGTTEDWSDGSGTVKLDQGEFWAAPAEEVSVVGVEVLELPEPEFNPENDDREIGSIWVDPETGSHFVRVDEPEHDGKPTFNGWTYLRYEEGTNDLVGPARRPDYHAELIKRLVPAK